MLQTILLVAMILISVALSGVILIQRSEGGALGMGGGPSGFMSASGAGNLLTKTTWILAGLFFAFAIGLTIVGNMTRANQSIVDPDAVGALAAPPVGQQQQPQPQAPAPAAPNTPSLQDLESSTARPATTNAAPPAQ